MWLLLSACHDPVNLPVDSGTPPADPSVAIVSPADGATVTGGTLTAEVSAEGFALRPKEEVARLLPPLPWSLMSTAHAHTPGEAPNGFVRYTLDDVVVAEVPETTVTLDLTGLAPGAHRLGVELSWPDGDAFYPPVTDTVGFSLEE